jgi:hypothetical protein
MDLFAVLKPYVDNINAFVKKNTLFPTSDEMVKILQTPNTNKYLFLGIGYRNINNPQLFVSHVLPKFIINRHIQNSTKLFYDSIEYNDIININTMIQSYIQYERKYTHLKLTLSNIDNIVTKVCNYVIDKDLPNNDIFVGNHDKLRSIIKQLRVLNTHDVHSLLNQLNDFRTLLSDDSSYIKTQTGVKVSEYMSQIITKMCAKFTIKINNVKELLRGYQDQMDLYYTAFTSEHYINILTKLTTAHATAHASVNPNGILIYIEPRMYEKEIREPTIYNLLFLKLFAQLYPNIKIVFLPCVYAPDMNLYVHKDHIDTENLYLDWCHSEEQNIKFFSDFCSNNNIIIFNYLIFVNSIENSLPLWLYNILKKNNTKYYMLDYDGKLNIHLLKYEKDLYDDAGKLRYTDETINEYFNIFYSITHIERVY